MSSVRGSRATLVPLLCLLAVVPACERSVADTPDRPLTESDFVFPALPAEMKVGEPVCLTVEPLVAGPFEYRWLQKLNHVDWDWSAPWTTSPTHAFQSTAAGVFSAHVDIRRPGRQEIELSRWLGEAAVSGPLVERIFHVPAAVALPTGVPIEFFVWPRWHEPEDLEFRLWDLLPEEKIVHDWAPWPLPPFVCSEPRTTALQVDVRLKRQPQVIDRRWLNTFTFFDRQEPSAANLLRNLISDDFEVFAFSEGLGILARELWLATHMLQWQHEGAGPAEARQRLEALPGVEGVEAPPIGPLRVRMAGGRVYEVDLEAFTLSQAGSPVLLRLTLERYPRCRQALDAMRHLPSEARTVGLLTLAVYEGYHYGTPAQLALMHVADAISHCVTQMDLLRRILETCGLPARYAFLATYDAQHNAAPHAFVQTRLDDGTPLLLDPTNGYMYLYDIADLGRRPVPEPVVLPQCRDLRQFDLRNLAARPGRVIVADALVPNRVPQTPSGGVVTTSPGPPSP